MGAGECRHNLEVVCMRSMPTVTCCPLELGVSRPLQIPEDLFHIIPISLVRFLFDCERNWVMYPVDIAA